MNLKNSGFLKIIFKIFLETKKNCGLFVQDLQGKNRFLRIFFWESLNKHFQDLMAKKLFCKDNSFRTYLSSFVGKIPWKSFFFKKIKGLRSRNFLKIFFSKDLPQSRFFDDNFQKPFWPKILDFLRSKNLIKFSSLIL